MNYPKFLDQTSLIQFFTNDQFPSVQFVECSTCEGTGYKFEKSDGKKEVCSWCDGFGEKFFQSTLDINKWFWIEEYFGILLLYIRWIYRDLNPVNTKYKHKTHYYENEVYDARPYVSGYHMARETINNDCVFDRNVEFTMHDCPFESQTEKWKNWQRGFSDGLIKGYSYKARKLGFKE
jgi:hypothetical protein